MGYRAHPLAAAYAGYSTIFKGKMLRQNIQVCIWSKMQWPLPLSCDMSEICTSTHVQKITNRKKWGNSFLKNIFVVPIQKLGNSYRQRNQWIIVCTCTTYGGNRVCRMGSALFFLPLITFKVARVQAYLRKSEGSWPVKSNYLLVGQGLPAVPIASTLQILITPHSRGPRPFLRPPSCSATPN